MVIVSVCCVFASPVFTLVQADDMADIMDRMTATVLPALWEKHNEVLLDTSKEVCLSLCPSLPCSHCLAPDFRPIRSGAGCYPHLRRRSVPDRAEDRSGMLSSFLSLTTTLSPACTAIQMGGAHGRAPPELPAAIPAAAAPPEAPPRYPRPPGRGAPRPARIGGASPGCAI